MTKVRVILVEDHHVVRAGVAAFLEKVPEIEVVGETARMGELLEMVEAEEPDVVVLDARIPGQPVIETARLLSSRHPQVGVLVLSAYNRQEYVVGLLEAGALGYLLKDDSPEALVRGIRAVAQGKAWISPRVEEELVRVLRRGGRPASGLSPREKEVLKLMARGYTNLQIAEALGLAGQTVKNHVRSVLGKLGARTRVQAVLRALAWGLVSLEEEATEADRESPAQATDRQVEETPSPASGEGQESRLKSTTGGDLEDDQ